MSDRQLVDAAWAELLTSTISGAEWQKRVTNGYKGKPYNWQATAYGRAKLLLDQVDTAAPPPTSGVSYPASYFTGPLGSNNILPGKQGAFLIDFSGAIGWTWAQKQAGIVKREADMGRKYDGIQVHYGGFPGDNGLNPYVAAERQEEWVSARGSFACVAWGPNGTNAEVNSGAQDTNIAAAARHFASYKPHRLMMRMWHEFDNPNLSYAPLNGAAGGPGFIAAWQRIVGIFQAQGATNCGFWWCPNEGYVRTTVNASYPGDAYVDWVGSDSYNWCAANSSGCYSTPMHAGQATFAEIFDYPQATSQHNLWGPRKPFVIGETGTILDASASSTWKGNWFRAIPAAAQLMQYLRGVCFYDQDVSAVEGPAANFRVDAPTSNADPYAGFKQMAADPWFNTGSPR